MNSGGDYSSLDTFFSVIAIIVLFAIIYSIISYVISSITIYTVAREKNMDRPYFAWIPILNNYIFIKQGNGCVYAMFALLGGFIPRIGPFITMGYSVYMLIMLHEISKEYDVESLPLVIIGAFIPFVIWVQYYRIYKSARNRIDGKLDEINLNIE